ncbi:MAG: HAMP domain-containing histidine kinase [Actinomycetales bacterium]|nr:HAMP domain-containing histidine kinase [Actinomycetales bacterium]
MKLQRKLTLLTVTVVALVGIAVGVWTVYNNYWNQVSKIDQRLRANSTILQKTPENKLSTALLLGGQRDIPMTVAYVSQERDLTVLVESEFTIAKVPSADFLSAATGNAIQSPTSKPGRIRVAPLGDGEFVLFASSTSEILNERASQLRWLLFSLLVCIGIGSFAINRLIRSDVQKIEHLAQQATIIATGKLDEKLPEGKGSSEVDDLSRAFRAMVESLVSAISAERQSNQAMQNFLSDASHELRTPLTAISGYSEILGTTIAEPSEQQSRALSRIKSEIKRMDDLISDLLILAELGEKPEFQFDQVDISPMINEQLTDLAHLQPSRTITASVVESAICSGDARYLRVMLTNIFTNIRRHTPPEAAVSCRVVVSATEVTVEIDDAGPGLPEKFYSSDTSAPFERFDSSRSRLTGGSGLGLSIIKAVVEVHCGSLVLTRSSLGGHRTLIVLPAQTNLVDA